MFLAPARILFLIFGIIFTNFSILFALAKTKKTPFTTLCTAFFANFGGFFLLLAFWEYLGPLVMAAHVVSLAAGLSLVPIGLTLFLKLLGGQGRETRWMVPCILATVAVWFTCSLLFLLGTGEPLPLSICYTFIFLSYAITWGVQIHKLRPLKNLPTQLFRFLILLGLCIFLVGLMVGFQVVHWKDGQYVIWLLMATFFCFTAVFVFRYPEIFLRLEAQSKAARYGRSLLSSVDIPSKLKKLNRLMEEDQVFRQEDLYLEDLADKVSLTPHQLSELLNMYQKKSFSEFIMGFRIEAAKHELMDLPDATIIDVAFSCGFGAKSTFNVAFRKATGFTPTAFRLAHQVKKD